MKRKISSGLSPVVENATPGSSTDIVQSNQSITVVSPNTTNSTTEIKHEETSITVLGYGIRGDDGERGEPGDGTSLNIVATNAIGGMRVVVSDNGGASYADSTNPNHYGRVLGLNETAVDVGDMMTIIVYSKVTDSSWNWIPDQMVFFNNVGSLTQSAPTSGFNQSVGVAITPTTIYVNLGDPIEL